MWRSDNKTVPPPAINLKGHWLKAAGFETGFTFTVKILKQVFGVDTGQRRDPSHQTTKPTTASSTECNQTHDTRADGGVYQRLENLIA
ncbi:MAG: SymE family type I addiction module toxin [Proteus mirabilis]